MYFCYLVHTSGRWNLFRKKDSLFAVTAFSFVKLASFQAGGVRSEVTRGCSDGPHR